MDLECGRPSRKMAAFLKAAFEVLRGRREPLSPEEIVKIAKTEGLLRSKGATPASTMRARLSTEIARRGIHSIFMRTRSGLFALRSSGLEEYVAPRFSKSLFDEDVVVFPAAQLSTLMPKKGVNTVAIDAKRFLSICFGMRRAQAEQRFDVIQVVTQFIVHFESSLLTHKRTKRLPESRLHGFYSLAFGGHLNPDDVGNFNPLFDPFDVSRHPEFLERELREELRFKGDARLRFGGLLYDDSQEVSRQHLAILFDAFLPSPHFSIGERGFLVDPQMESIEQISARRAEFENWSQILIDRELSRGDG